RCSTPCRRMAPALLTSASMPPKCSAAWSMAARTATSSRTSSFRARALPPAWRTSSATVWMVPGSLGCGASLLAAMTTLAPSRAARRAISRPMPRLAPVMNSVLSCSVMGCSFLRGHEKRGRPHGDLPLRFTPVWVRLSGTSVGWIALHGSACAQRWTRKALSTLRFARSGVFRLDLHQQLTVLHLVAPSHADAAHDAIDTGLERMLHLHGFQHHQQLALGDAGAFLDQHLDDGAI